jgi:hypothetical protein
MHPAGVEHTICLFLFVTYFARYLVCPSEYCVAIISFSVLFSDHTRQSYESVLFINTVCLYCEYIVRALLCFPNFKDTANRACACCMISSVFFFSSMLSFISVYSSTTFVIVLIVEFAFG